MIRKRLRQIGLPMLGLVLVAAGLVAYRSLSKPAGPIYVDIADASPAATPVAFTATGSRGSWHVDCGRNQEGMYNSDNLVAQPGVVGGAHHVHDYVGNTSTNALSTNDSLAAAGTTCQFGDKSTYYWPVLLMPSASTDMRDMSMNHSTIAVPTSVRIEYLGSPVSSVIAMPRFLRATTGNPHGSTEGGANAEHVRWTCSGTRDKVTTDYPECGAGQQTVRVFTFPSCWNGITTDSPDHRGHLVFPVAGGGCPVDTFPVPQLHIEVAYTLPRGLHYVIDAFPEEHYSSVTDHAMYVDAMPDSLMAHVVDCINSGQRC
jgi:hypothetical protein